MKIFFSENNVFSTYYTFFPKIRKMIQNIKNRFNTYYTFFLQKKVINKKIVVNLLITIKGVLKRVPLIQKQRLLW
jgi:hypothetical protein